VSWSAKNAAAAAALATFIQGVASALRHQLLEHAPHGSYSIHQLVKLRKLSLGERSPALRRASNVAEAKEQMPNFSQRKTELARNVHWFTALSETAFIFDVIVPDLDSAQPSGMDFIDPLQAEKLSDGILRARRLQPDDAVGYTAALRTINKSSPSAREA
jgi:hypothetical protein